MGVSRLAYRSAFFKTLDNAFEEAKRHDALPHVKAQLESTFVSLPIPQQILKDLKDNDYRSLSEEIKNAALSFFSLTTTLPCGLANRQGRQCQDRAQDNCRVSAERVMLTPYKDRVLSQQQFKYDEITHHEYSIQTAKDSRTHKIDTDFFRPGSHSPVLPLRGASSCKQKADFFTTTPYNAAQIYAHAAYWKHCVIHPHVWDQGGLLWLCQLMSCGMLVQHKPTKDFKLVLNNVDNVAQLCINMVPKKFQGVECIGVAGISGSTLPYSWAFCTDLTTWGCRRVKWIGHSWRLLHTKTIPNCKLKAPAAKDFSDGPFLIQHGPELTVYQGACLKCFKGCSEPTLKMLAVKVDAKVPPGADKFELCKGLIMTGFPNYGGRLSPL